MGRGSEDASLPSREREKALEAMESAMPGLLEEP